MLFLYFIYKFHYQIMRLNILQSVYFFNLMIVSMLLSVLVNRFSVFCMQDFFIPPLRPFIYLGLRTPLSSSTNSWSQDSVSPVCRMFNTTPLPIADPVLKTPSPFFHQDGGDEMMILVSSKKFSVQAMTGLTEKSQQVHIKNNQITYHISEVNKFHIHNLISSPEATPPYPPKFIIFRFLIPFSQCNVQDLYVIIQEIFTCNKELPCL